MRYQYRVSKYDPSFRDARGAYLKDDWTSFADVGRTFNGASLTMDDYIAKEDAYLGAIQGFLKEAGFVALQLRGLENSLYSCLPPFVQPFAMLSVPQCAGFARMVFREQVWGKLVVPGRAYVHFGYDYYMYLGLPSRCPKTIKAAHKNGLFVESLRSPYLRARSGT